MDMPTNKTTSENIDVLVLIRKILKVLFLAPVDGMSRVLNNFLAIIYHIIIALSIIGAIAAISLQFMVGIEDFNVILESGMGIFDYIGFMYLSLFFRIKVPKFKKILENVNIFLEFCSSSVITKAEEEVTFYTKFFIVYFFIGFSLNGLVQLLNLKSCKEGRRTEFYKKYDPCGTPLRILSPLDMTVPINHLIVVVLQIYACIMVVAGIVAVTLTLIGFLIHIIMQIRNCRNLVVNIFPNSNNWTNADIIEIKKKMTFCIRYQQTIIRYTQEVYGLFNLLLILHISLTSLIVGIILYLITSVEGTDKLRYILHLGGWIAILFLTCYYGEQVLTESTSIADAAYESLWYDAPSDLQKNIKFMIMRGQNPLKLRVASTGEISLGTFVAILKTAYSFFALLITISD